MSTLLLAETDGDAPDAATARLVRAAQALGAPVDVLVMGHGVGAVAEEAARLAGVRRVLVADDPALAGQLAEPCAALLRHLLEKENYDAVVGGMGAAHRDILPRLAGMLGGMALTDIIGIEDANIFRRPCFAGNIVSTVRLPDAPKILLVRAFAFAPVEAVEEAAPVESIEVPPDLPTPVRIVGEERHDAAGPTLETARIVLGMGRGAADAESRELLAALAEKLGAAIAATRMVVDDGLAPNDWQVGQTGKSIAPALYIAFGVSGAHQHLAGVRDAETIVAINTDAEAPIFKGADLGLVMDAREALRALLART